MSCKNKIYHNRLKEFKESYEINRTYFFNEVDEFYWTTIKHEDCLIFLLDAALFTEINRKLKI